MKIRYSPAARDDLRQLKSYLTLEFGASVAAKSLAKIVSDISSLRRCRHLARPLSAKTGRKTDYRYFLVGKYSIVILSEFQDGFSVIRVLDGRTDYVKTIFGEQ